MLIDSTKGIKFINAYFVEESYILFLYPIFPVHVMCYLFLLNLSLNFMYIDLTKNKLKIKRLTREIILTFEFVQCIIEYHTCNKIVHN